MKINQVNITYQPGEDRLLLKINTLDRAEVGFWLTRALVARLLASLGDLEKVAYGGEADAFRFVGMPPAAVTDVRRELHAAESDYQTPFDSLPQFYPLGQQALLAAQLVLRTEGEFTAFTLATATGLSLTVNLDAKLLASINTLLVDVVRKIDWGLLHAAPVSPAATGAPILH